MLRLMLGLEPNVVVENGRLRVDVWAIGSRVELDTCKKR